MKNLRIDLLTQGGQGSGRKPNEGTQWARGIADQFAGVQEDKHPEVLKAIAEILKGIRSQGSGSARGRKHAGIMEAAKAVHKEGQPEHRAQLEALLKKYGSKQEPPAEEAPQTGFKPIAPVEAGSAKPTVGSLSERVSKSIDKEPTEGQGALNFEEGPKPRPVSDAGARISEVKDKLSRPPIIREPGTEAVAPKPGVPQPTSKAAAPVQGDDPSTWDRATVERRVKDYHKSLDRIRDALAESGNGQHKIVWATQSPQRAAQDALFEKIDPSGRLQSELEKATALKIPIQEWGRKNPEADVQYKHRGAPEGEFNDTYGQLAGASRSLPEHLKGLELTADRDSPQWAKQMEALSAEGADPNHFVRNRLKTAAKSHREQVGRAEDLVAYPKEGQEPQEAAEPAPQPARKKDLGMLEGLFDQRPPTTPVQEPPTPEPMGATSGPQPAPKSPPQHPAFGERNTWWNPNEVPQARPMRHHVSQPGMTPPQLPTINRDAEKAAATAGEWGKARDAERKSPTLEEFNSRFDEQRTNARANDAQRRLSTPYSRVPERKPPQPYEGLPEATTAALGRPTLGERFDRGMATLSDMPSKIKDWGRQRRENAEDWMNNRNKPDFLDRYAEFMSKHVDEPAAELKKKRAMSKQMIGRKFQSLEGWDSNGLRFSSS